MAEDIISIMDIYKTTFNPHLQWFERLLNSHLRQRIALFQHHTVVKHRHTVQE